MARCRIFMDFLNMGPEALLVQPYRLGLSVGALKSTEEKLPADGISTETQSLKRRTIHDFLKNAFIAYGFII